MKKLLSFLTFALGGSALLGQSQRLVLLEEFTQASCGPCAAANPAFNTLIQANTTKAVSLKFQTSWPGVDPMNAQDAAEIATRVSYYGITGVPDAIQDGVDYSSPGSVTQTTINTEYAVASPFSIQLSHWFNATNDSIFIYCQITCTQAVTMTTPFARIALIEKTISFASEPGTNGETKFYNVMRKMYPNAGGTALAKTWTVGQKKAITFKAKIPSYIYDKTQLATVAYVQDDGNKNVKQAAFSASASSPSTAPPVADFTADVTTSCNGIINFQDQSALFPTAWHWDFGDGDTSALSNPVHKYLNSGTYTTMLTAKNANGSNMATKTSYITVNLVGAAPAGVNGKRCGPGVVNLSASPSAGGTLNWYNSAGVLVNTGTTYSPTLSAASVKFYVTETIANAVTAAGRVDSALGGGGYFTSSATHGLYFDVLKPCTLVSVKTYANSAGNRTVQVLDASGTIIQSAVVNIPTGMSTVNLNFSLPAGTGYFIQIPSSSSIGLYRNSANAAYPYSSGVINVTGNDAGATYYYYFYDWKVLQNPCASPAATVTGTDSCLATGISETGITRMLNVFPNPSTGLIHISCQIDKPGNYTLEIVNVLGQTVYEDSLNNFSGSYLKQLDLSTRGKGMYMLIISNGKERVVRKLSVN